MEALDAREEVDFAIIKYLSIVMIFVDAVLRPYYRVALQMSFSISRDRALQ
jgi:hypothetical protein